MKMEKIWHGILRRPYRLHFKSYGDNSKPAIVLLHGIAASGEDWRTLIPLLTPQYHCITIDLLGFGRSPRPQWAEYTMEQHVRAIRRTIRLLHVSGPYTLIGHSLGSLLATRYARKYPGDIARVLLLSPPVYPPLDTIEGKLALRRTDLLMRAYRTVREHPRMTTKNIERLSKLGIVPRSVILHSETWVPFKRSLQQCIEQQTILQDIRDIRVPIDIYYGTLDAVVVGANVRALARLREVRVRTFTGGHAFGHSYAKVVARQLTSY